MKPTIVKRGIITYLLYPEKVIVGVGANQWVSYNQYDNWNRQGITQFRNAIKNSNENQYATPSDQMTLASECGIKGAGTARPKDIDL